MKYITKDVNFGAYLWSLSGVGQIGDYFDDRTVYFEFEIPDITEEEFQQVQMDFRNGKTVVDPLEFCKRQDQLRQIVRNYIRRPV